MRNHRSLSGCIRFYRSFQHTTWRIDTHFGEQHCILRMDIRLTVQAIVTIAYTIVHTTYSIKQRALTYQQLDLATVKKTTYIANRLVVSLCVLWLLTAGWNMILVARRPSCLPNQLEGQAWEAGITCLVSRIGMTLAMIAL